MANSVSNLYTHTHTHPTQVAWLFAHTHIHRACVTVPSSFPEWKQTCFYNLLGHQYQFCKNEEGPSSCWPMRTDITCFLRILWGDGVGGRGILSMITEQRWSKQPPALKKILPSSHFHAALGFGGFPSSSKWMVLRLYISGFSQNV